MESEKKSIGGSSRIENVSLFVVLILVVLLPLFFIPSLYVSIASAKVILLYVGIIVSFCLWIVARLREGKMAVPRHYFFAGLALIPFSYLLSSIFSDSRSTSLFGLGFETQTFGFILVVSLLTYITAYTFASKKAITYAYFAFLITFPIVIIYQVLRLLIGPGFFTFNVFFTNTGSLLGGWNDLGIYCGIIALFTFLTLELLPVERWMKLALTIIFAIALFFLTVINFTLVWYIVGVIALIFFIYNFSFSRSKLAQETSRSQRPGLPVLSLVVIIIAFAFVIIKGNIYNTLSSEPFNLPLVNKLDIANTEVRPSWSSTFSIAKNSLLKDPVFGVGPNRFTNSWQLSKPADVNSTIFWATDFNAATGYIPTSIITTGLLGLVSWIVFLGLFLYAGFRGLFRKSDAISHYLTTSSFIISLYLWIFAFFYIPSASIIALTFFFTGLFFASLIEDGVIKVSTFDFVKDPRTSFISVLVFIVLVLGVLLFGYTSVRKFTASFYFNKGLAIANTTGNVDDVERNIGRAAQFNEADLYYRVLSNISLARLNTLVANQNSIASSTLQTQFTTIYANALATAQKAVSLDKTNYQNWLTEGLVYDVLVQLGNPDAYARAQADYAEAAKLNPTNPAIPLNLARLEAAHKNNAKAKDYIRQALVLKNNYTDAIFLLAQIQVAEGDIKSAIQSVLAETSISPNDPGIYFDLGLLYYNNKEYSNAVGAFERSVTLVPNYANAKYFLGLSYYRVNKQSDAIKQFQELRTSNPDNKEVSLILSNLQAGKDPFANVTPPLDNKPEKRSTPPIKDTTSNTDSAGTQ